MDYKYMKYLQNTTAVAAAKPFQSQAFWDRQYVRKIQGITS